ncbi:MAG TPA: hypothetical protein VGF92_18635 [Stellaceae bacterium]|jgi:hypothetical protein
MKLGIVWAASLAALVSGCTYSSSEAVKTLPPELAKNAKVVDITVLSVPANVSPQFKDMLTAHLRDETAKCARGAQPLKLEVAVSDFTAQDPGMTFLAGSSDKIKGSARLIDPSTNQVVGDYDISHSFGAGGLLGMALLSAGENKMSDAFAEEVCSRAFAAP